MTAPSDLPSPLSSPTKPEFRERLPAESVARMRELVEGTAWSYRRIGAELGVAASTVSRYAADHGWRRPAGAAPARIARERDRAAESLWRLAARQAETLEEQDRALSRDALEPLASLTRALGTLTPKFPPAGIAEELAPEKPPRSLNELHAELEAHLRRIEREEAEWWDRHAWHFENGAGI